MNKSGRTRGRMSEAALAESGGVVDKAVKILSS